MGSQGLDIATLALIMLVIAVVIAIALGVRTVPQGYNFTVERFGRYSRTLGAGLGLIIPLFDRIGHKVTMSSALLFRRSCPTM